MCRFIRRTTAAINQLQALLSLLDRARAIITAYSNLTRLSSPHGGSTAAPALLLSVTDTVAPWKIGSPFIVEVPAITCG